MSCTTAQDEVLADQCCLAERLGLLNFPGNPPATMVLSLTQRLMEIRLIPCVTTRNAQQTMTQTGVRTNQRKSPTFNRNCKQIQDNRPPCPVRSQPKHTLRPPAGKAAGKGGRTGFPAGWDFSWSDDNRSCRRWQVGLCTSSRCPTGRGHGKCAKCGRQGHRAADCTQ